MERKSVQASLKLCCALSQLLSRYPYWGSDSNGEKNNELAFLQCDFRNMASRNPSTGH